jgi:hypothetical protein
MKSEKIIFALVISLIFAIAFYLALDFEPGAQLSPIVVTVPCIILLLSVIIDEVKLPITNRVEVEPAKTLSITEVRQREWSIILWIILLITMIYILGFLIAIPLYLLLMLKYRGKEKWSVSILLTSGATVVIYFFFVSILKVNLHRGLWE